MGLAILDVSDGLIFYV